MRKSLEKQTHSSSIGICPPHGLPLAFVFVRFYWPSLKFRHHHKITLLPACLPAKSNYTIRGSKARMVWLQIDTFGNFCQTFSHMNERCEAHSNSKYDAYLLGCQSACLPAVNLGCIGSGIQRTDQNSLGQDLRAAACAETETRRTPPRAGELPR